MRVPARVPTRVQPPAETRHQRPAHTASLAGLLTLAALLFTAPALCAQAPAEAQVPATTQAPASESGSIAIVPFDSKNPDLAAKVTGALEVSQGKAVIAAGGSITSGSETTQVILPHRGVLRVCASTTVKLAADSSVPTGEVPGLLMAMDHGAVEASFATGRNSDILLTPDFRILIGGPGPAEVKVRLGQNGDTCVDNAGVNAPYVLVSSVFDGGAYRVQPGQRVMFQHGSLHEVVDQEKEPCGCPPPAASQANEFPLAQSEGLAPLAAPAPSASAKPGQPPQTTETLAYSAADHTPKPAEAAQPASTPPAGAPANPAAKPPSAQKKPGIFTRVGRFFRRIFGAE
ncbi:MAG TPA: hypothetical protein VGE83_09840 [Terracidiphilus sp.]